MVLDSRLERYRRIATLGAGGMASVVLAEDSVLGRQVALKRMHPVAADPRGLLRLRREALVGASMSHRNLVSIYDVIDSEDGDAVIVMEYVEGETLRDALSREGRLAVREALRVLGGVAAGMDAIHKRGIVHRDVKPANVLLGIDGSVKLADLGIASVPDHTRITTAGTVLGSFRYMAPEQLKDGPATRAIDIYALAAVAFEALSGQQARRESNALAVAHAIATQPPPDLREFWPEAPPGAAEVLIHGMCRDPAGRPEAAGELVARLRAALEPEDTAPVRVPVGGRRVGWVPAAAASAGVAGPAAAARPTSPAGARPVTSKKPVSLAPQAAAAASSALGAAAGHVSSSGPHIVGAAAPSDRGSAPRKTFRARRPAGWGRVVAPLAVLLAAGGVVLLLLNSGRSSSTGGGPSSTRATTTGAHTRSGVALGSTAHRRKAAVAAATTRAGGGAVTVTSSGSAAGKSRSSAPPPTTASSSGAVAGTAGAGAPTSSTTAGPEATGASTPAAAVETFYELAAAHRYSEAWALADPSFRSQLGGYASFQAGQAADRSITFREAQLTQQRSGVATVYVQTTSVRTTGTQHCAGTVQVVLGDSRAVAWLLHRIAINCT